MKTKDMRACRWQRVTKRRFFLDSGVTNGRRYAASLMFIDEVTSPFVNSRGAVLADAGYVWLQYALEGERWWLTAAFGPDGTLWQMYFDVTDGNRFTDPDDPDFDDLYLDVVLDPDHAVTVLDRDELEEALCTGDITEEQHEAAVKESERLVSVLSSRPEEMFFRCAELYGRLKDSYGKTAPGSSLSSDDQEES